MSDRLPIAVLASGEGSNFAAIAAAAARAELPVDIRLVLSDQPKARVLGRARELSILAVAVSRADFPSVEQHESAVAAQIDAVAPTLIVLAGYMRVLTPRFVARYAGRIINIHPSLLPALKGLDTHRRALASGAKEHGASVHFVTDVLDGGPVIARARIAVLPEDTPATLEARVHSAEHRLYPTVIGWFAAGRLHWRDGAAWLDGTALTNPREIALPSAPAAAGDAVRGER